MAAIKDSSVETFLAELGSKASTPGGGSAAAVMGGVGAALVSMVCHLTIGKKKYAAAEGELTEVLAKADDLRGRLVAAIEEDVSAFDAVMGAYAMPKETEAQQAGRKRAIQAGLRLATEAPLACARLCREVIDLAGVAAEKGNAAVISDAGVAVLAAFAALRSSALNVYVNAKAIEDRGYAEAALRELDALLGDAQHKTEAAYEAVRTQLNG
jgi:methenyltetrahydrofolate cyclohydrolase